MPKFQCLVPCHEQGANDKRESTTVPSRLCRPLGETVKVKRARTMPPSTLRWTETELPDTRPVYVSPLSAVAMTPPSAAASKSANPLKLPIGQFIRAIHRPDNAAMLGGGAAGGTAATTVFCSAVVSICGSGPADTVVACGGGRSPPLAGRFWFLPRLERRSRASSP